MVAAVLTLGDRFLAYRTPPISTIRLVVSCDQSLPTSTFQILDLPAELIERVFKDLLQLQQNWQQRTQRLPDSIKFAETFERIWVADGSTLEALFHVPRGQLISY